VPDPAGDRATALPVICHTLDQIRRAAAEYVRAQGWRLTPEQMERFAVLLRPHLGHGESRTGNAA